MKNNKIFNQPTVLLSMCNQPQPECKPLPPLECSAESREFGQVRDVELIYGIKRDTVFNLLQAGKIHGILLQAMGKKSGIRFIHMTNVRSYIHSQMLGATCHLTSSSTATTDLG